MRKYLALFLAAFVFFSGGCTVKNGGAPTQMQVEAKRDQLTELSSSKTVSIVGQPYLGAKPIVRESGEEIPVLGKNVTLKQQGTLSEIAASLSAIAPLSAQVAEADGEDVQPAKPAASEPPLDDLGLPPLATSLGGAGQIAVSYTGSLRGLLDTIASQSGYGWGLRRQNEPRHIQRNPGTDVHRTGRAGSRFIRKPALEQEPGAYWWFLHQRFEHQFNRFVWRYVRTNLSNQQN